MPPLFLAAGGFLGYIASGLVSRVLLSLGMGVVSFIGLGFVLDYAVGQFAAAVNQLPAALLQLAGLMKLDVAMNIIFGCISARYTLGTLNGVATKFQLDPSKYA